MFVALQAPLREHEREQAKAWRNETIAWQNRHALWKNERDRILAEARKSRGERRPGAQADLQALGAEPAAPAAVSLNILRREKFEEIVFMAGHLFGGIN